MNKEAAPFGPSVRKRIEAAVKEAIGLGQIPGAVVLVAVDGMVVYHEAFGQAQIEPEKVPMKKDTIFDMASLTKPCATALGYVILADEGKLNFRDRVGRWLPEFTGGGKENVTLLDLLTHTGGLDDSGLYDPKNPMVTTAKIFDLLWTKQLYAEPGTAYLYADYNYITLGKALENASGMTLDRFFATRIAAPLGLKDAGYLPPESKRGRIAATASGPDGKMLRGWVHDPRASDMGGVAGHAGLFSTARDTFAIVQTLLDGGKRGGKHLVSPAAAAAMTSVQSPAGCRPRMIGWDSDPDGYGPRGDFFPFGGFGHTGFTGTSAWADKGTRTVVVILSNRVHPKGEGSADPLRRRIANIVAGEVTTRMPAFCRPAGKGVLTGIDVLEGEKFSRLAGRRIGLVTNLSVLNQRGETTLEVMRRAPGVLLAAIFTPEHGLEVKLDDKIPSGGHEEMKVPVYSLYGDSLRPTQEQLKRLDILVVDLPDIGVRFYTYPATLGYCLEEAAKAGVEVMVLDRPNPITGLHVEGPLLSRERFSFTGYTSLPVRHGMTLGELGMLFNSENKIGAKLTVIRIKGWRRGMWFDETGLPWANPSPNIRNLTQAILYPAVGLLESTNMSVGRGTDAPFERFGAPWIDGAVLARELNAQRLPGIRFYPVSFTPNYGPCKDEVCHGCILQLLDRDAFRPILTGVTMASALNRLFGDKFRLAGLDNLLCAPEAREKIQLLVPPSEIVAGWRADEESFEDRREKFLLY
jgi:uncharacterized protein YbbC (DUF1343 family)/CubicO group peptidase (beta-lactamase class C family)